MTNNMMKSIFTFFAIILSGILLFTACDSSTGSDDPPHADDVEGLELLHDGEIHFRYLDGEVTEPGQMHYVVGEEYKFTVRFLNHDGDPLNADDFDESYSLGWDIEDEEVLAIEQRDDDGRWEFHLIPLLEGDSGVQIQLKHEDHSDFETPPTDSDDAIRFLIGVEEEEDTNN